MTCVVGQAAKASLVCLIIGRCVARLWVRGISGMVFVRGSCGVLRPTYRSVLWGDVRLSCGSVVS